MRAYLLLPCIAFLANAASKEGPQKHVIQYFGINESGAEFAPTVLPGVEGKDYTWYNESTFDTFTNAGVNIIRINFLMERLVPNHLHGPLDKKYAQRLTDMVHAVTSRGATALICPHNYGRYYGKVINQPAQFKLFWKNVASRFKNNKRVMFDVNNEFHDMNQNLVVKLNQAAIDGIRAAGAKEQWITAEGNAYTGAWTWTTAKDKYTGLTNAQTMHKLHDKYEKLMYQMHQYLDQDGSGTSSDCVSETVFQERLETATEWLRQHSRMAILGEYAGGANPTCQAAIHGGLTYMRKHSYVWRGAIWWAAGPWWDNYIFDMEEPQGIAYKHYFNQIRPFFV